MFERFTSDARAVVVDAQSRARESGSPRIDPLHLLAGLLRTPSDTVRSLLAEFDVTPEVFAAELDRLRQRGGISDLDAQALGEFGIDVERIIERVEQIHGKGVLASGPPRNGWRSVPFSPAAKKTLECGLREAVAAGDRHLGQEHLLLALAEEPGPAADVLTKHGIDHAAIREAIHQHAAGPGS